MKLEYVTRTGVFDSFYTRTKLQEVLEEFANSDKDFVKLTFTKGEYASPSSAQGSVAQAIKRFKHGFKVRMIKGELYLDKLA